MTSLSKLNKARQLVARVSNWPTVLADHLGLSRRDYDTRLRNGLRVHVRSGTDDRHVVFEVLVEGIYPVPVERSSTVIDIGAHIGTFSLLAASRGARVLSYEPFPPNYRALRHNISLNDAVNVQAFDLAVAETPGTRTLFIPDNTTFSGRNSLYPGRGAKSVAVRCTTLREIYEQHELADVALLKVDCQDSEYEVLYSADASVLQRTRAIVAECEVMQGPPEWNIHALAAHLGRHGFATRIDGSFLFATKDPSLIAERETRTDS